MTVFVMTGCASHLSNGTEESTEKNTVSELTIQTPSGIAIASPVYHLLETNNLGESVEKINYFTWNTPDELRARITSSQAQISAVPTYVGANLYNKGMDIQLINTLIWGILYVIGPEGKQMTLEDLKGETIYVPFKSDMPDLVFQYLLKENGIDAVEDIDIQYISTPQEVVQMLAAGKTEYAILPEHTASLAIANAKKEGKALAKTISLQEEWAKVTGKEARIPQAGIIVNKALIESNPEVVEELQLQLKASIQSMNDAPAESAKIIAKYQAGLEETFIANLIPSLNLEFVTAQEAKEELEYFFNELATLSPDIIGGKLPDAEFYYQK